MIKKLKSIFSNASKTKRGKIGLILSIVALVEVFAIMIVSTSAWIESISSIKIYTKDGAKGKIESPLSQQVNLDSSKSADIDLTKYFRPSGGYHLTGASSADGDTMFFPVVSNSGGNRTTEGYRIGSVSDKNVNYVSFTIRTKTKVNLSFEKVPTIKFGGTALSDANKGLVRFSVGDNNGNFKIYSLADKITEDVVHAEDGSTLTTTVYPFSDFVQGKGRVVETTANGYLTFNMWIQDPEAKKSSVYNNKELNVSDLKLVIVTPFTVKAVTKVNGNYVESNAGGNVAIEDTEYGSEAVYFANVGTKINLRAAANSSSGYELVGWATSATGTVNNNSGVNPYEYTITKANEVLYAKFSNERSLYMRPDYVHKNASGTAQNLVYKTYIYSTDNTGTWYDMTKVTSGEWKDYYECSYKGTAANVIFCYMAPNCPSASQLNSSGDSAWNNRWLQTFNLRAPSSNKEFGYVVTSRLLSGALKTDGEAFTGYDDADNSRADGNKVFNNNKLLGYWTNSHAEINVDYCTGFDSSAGEIHAKLKNSTSSNTAVTFYKTTDTQLLCDGYTYQDVDENGNYILNQNYNKMVVLEAKASSSYKFLAWYLDKAGNQPVGVSELPAPKNGESITYYAKFEKKPAKTITIYALERGYGDNSTYAYIYDDKGKPAGDWPGTKMTYSKTTGLYSCTFQTEATGKFKVIINNNGNSQYPGQNEDGLSGDITDNAKYLFGKDSLTSFSPTGKKYVYLDANWDWGTKEIYRFGGTSPDSEFPGIAMENLYDSVYCAEMNGNTKFIFSGSKNNNRQKTGDVTLSDFNDVRFKFKWDNKNYVENW